LPGLNGGGAAAAVPPVDATAWPLYRWPPCGNVPTLQTGAT